MADDRSIELEIEVSGTPEDVWAAIATGPGITAWFVPTTVEERDGGAVVQQFGAGDEMQVAGEVEAWEPPHRFVYGGGGMAFEWLVEARDQATCVVRLVNSGFGTGEEWDDQFDGMESGWRIFLQVLRLHLERFGGQPASRVMAMAMVPTSDPDALWETMRERFDLPVDIVSEGERSLVFTLDAPAPGTGLLAAEGKGDQLAVSAWFSFYGPGAEAAAAAESPRWQAWIEELGTNSP